jgi:hypothetical protein
MNGDKLPLSGLVLCDVQTGGFEGTPWDLVGLGEAASVEIESAGSAIEQGAEG